LIFLNESGTIATGSLRRQAQWLNNPTHKVVDLRGNEFTHEKVERWRLERSCFAAAGLERINLKPENFINLD
jgi:hydroxymethylbilane synthase